MMEAIVQRLRRSAPKLRNGDRRIFGRRGWALAGLLLLTGAISAAGCGSTNAATQAAQTAAATGAAIVTAPGALYTFAVCGDNRTLGIDNGVLGKIVTSARARGAAFIVDTGDVSDSGSKDQLSRYRDFTAASGLMFYTVPGNHDVGAGGVSGTYASIIGPTHYSFDFDGDHFVVVDNADDKTGIDAAQMSWLRQDVAANAGRPHQFIFAHIPVASPTFDIGHMAGESGGSGLKTGQELAQLAEQTPNVSDLFFGHIHAYITYKLGNLPVYITGGAGAPLYEPDALGGYYHYLLVTVFPGQVKVEVVKV